MVTGMREWIVTLSGENRPLRLAMTAFPADFIRCQDMLENFHFTDLTGEEMLQISGFRITAGYGTGAQHNRLMIAGAARYF